MSDQKTAKNFREWLLWQKGIEVTKVIYLLTEQFSAEEKFGLTSQLRRASISVPSNIAEGSARRSRAEFSQFLSISHGSLAEMETPSILVSELHMATEEHVASLISRIH